MDCARYIRRETLVSMAINTALSLVFLVGVLGFGARQSVWGAGHYAFDLARKA